MNKFATGVFILAIATSSSLSSLATAAEPSWSPVIIATGDYPEQIKAMPIEQRPYRPLHFYGNTVRRNHYRGNPVAMPRDLSTTAGKLIRRQ